MIIKGKKRYLRHERGQLGRRSAGTGRFFFLGDMKQFVSFFAVLNHDAHFDS